MEIIYYAIATSDNRLLNFFYDDRYGITYVEFCESNLFDMSKGLFEKEEHAKYELNNILESEPSYDINELSDVDLSKLKIVKVDIDFTYNIL